MLSFVHGEHHLMSRCKEPEHFVYLWFGANWQLHIHPKTVQECVRYARHINASHGAVDYVKLLAQGIDDSRRKKTENTESSITQGVDLPLGSCTVTLKCHENQNIL
jgi:hypothetical protein